MPSWIPARVAHSRFRRVDPSAERGPEMMSWERGQQQIVKLALIGALGSPPASRRDAIPRCRYRYRALMISHPNYRAHDDGTELDVRSHHMERLGQDRTGSQTPKQVRSGTSQSLKCYTTTVAREGLRRWFCRNAAMLRLHLELLILIGSASFGPNRDAHATRCEARL